MGPLALRGDDRCARSAADGGVVRTFTSNGGSTLNLNTASPGLSAGTGFVVGAGTVNLNNAAALGSSPNVTANGGSLNLGSGVSAMFASLAGTSGVVNLNGNTLTFGNGTASFGGSINDGTAAGAIVKNGGGTQTLSGVNSFTGGVTVASGTFG